MDQDQQDNLSRKHRLQNDLLIRESDYKKNQVRKGQLDIAMRQARRKMDLLAADIEQSKKEMAKIDSEQIMLEVEMKKLKKEILDI